jgi:hypothetical protein
MSPLQPLGKTNMRPPPKVADIDRELQALTADLRSWHRLPNAKINPLEIRRQMDELLDLRLTLT